MNGISKSISRLTGITFGIALLLTACGAGFDTAQCFAQTRYVPRGTQMKVRLETTIDTKEARNGDRFSATVLSPSRYADSTVEGHVAQIRQSGKIKGQTSILLVFDHIRLPDGESQSIRGYVTRVYGEKSVKEVDEEGRIKSGSRGASTAKRSAGGAAAGAIIGGIIGGGKGAAIGAGAGAGAGAGSNTIRESDRIRLEKGTEMLIRTSQ